VSYNELKLCIVSVDDDGSALVRADDVISTFDSQGQDILELRKEVEDLKADKLELREQVEFKISECVTLAQSSNYWKEQALKGSITDENLKAQALKEQGDE
jgi:hypothetical protein